MKSKICPACNTANNPSFNSCYHCGQSFDPTAIVNPGVVKREAYDAFKLSKFSNLFTRENFRVALCFLPGIYALGALNFLCLKVAPNVKELLWVMAFGPGLLITGWCIKYLLPKYSDMKWDIAENIFIAGLKTTFYGLLPYFVLSLKLLLISFPILLLFKFTPLSGVSNNISSVSAIRIPGTILMFAVQSYLSASIYAVTVRYLYEVPKKAGA